MFHTQSTRQHPAGSLITEMLATATQAADPSRQLTHLLHRDGNRLHIATEVLTVRSVVIIAVGKAAPRMAASACAILGDLVTTGVVVYKDEDISTPRHPQLAYYAAGHPVPDERSQIAALAVRHCVSQTTPDQCILVLLSGGGSALLVDPAPGITLAMLQELTQQLLASGATINHINTVRRRIDHIKGGGLAAAAGITPLRTLILSDVIGNDLSTIASGPTVANPDAADAAWHVLTNYGLTAQLPAPIVTALTNSSPAPVPPAPPPIIIGDIHGALQAAASVARTADLPVHILTDRLIGEARHVGSTLASIVHYHAHVGTPCCLLAGGETTVTLHRAGHGGRNQELALALAIGLESLHTGDPLCAAYASDGGDGPTDAAGAVVTRTSVQRARAAGVDPHHLLAQHDSYHFFAALNDHLRPGPTGTNVNDLFVAIMTPET
jgi:hydroxypyruvate reductase